MARGKRDVKLEPDAMIIVCARRDEGPCYVPGSSRDRCADCRADVHISPAAVRRRDTTPKSVVLCIRCGTRELDADPQAVVLPPTPEQEAELRAYYLRKAGWQL